MIILRENDIYKIYKNSSWIEVIENKKTGEIYPTIILDDSIRISTIFKVSKELSKLKNYAKNFWFRRNIHGEIVCCQGTYRVCKNGNEITFKKWDDVIKFCKNWKIDNLTGSTKPYYLD